MVKPISPSEAKRSKVAAIPDEVIEAFNELIVENLVGTTSQFTQFDVVLRIHKKFQLAAASEFAEPVTRDEIFARQYLEVESIYSQQGWVVEYDKPGYNENYKATFTFRQRMP